MAGTNSHGTIDHGSNKMSRAVAIVDANGDQSAGLPSSLADGADVTTGAIADAAVAAGAAGTISAKLRSISRDIIANIVLAAGSAIIGKVGIDQTTPGTTNAVQVVQAALTMVHTTATATSASGAMLATNASRKYALLINDGSIDVYIKLNVAAVANAGIRLTPNGGNYEMSMALGNLDTRAINGITVSGSANVIVTEG